MEDWDQETLEKVVESKKNEYNHNKPTEIVSSFFDSLIVSSNTSIMVVSVIPNMILEMLSLFFSPLISINTFNLSYKHICMCVCVDVCTVKFFLVLFSLSS
jgi:hypothetical protein